MRASQSTSPRLNGVRPRRPEQSRTEITSGLSLGVSVSMESGLEGRNNGAPIGGALGRGPVSMESGLEGRNNARSSRSSPRSGQARLNGVRPRRPEQSTRGIREANDPTVSMESGLEGRNNHSHLWGNVISDLFCLNGVRPRRPEQLLRYAFLTMMVRSVSMESGLEGRNNIWKEWKEQQNRNSSQWSPA